jgi:hypothetical protein
MLDSTKQEILLKLNEELATLIANAVVLLQTQAIKDILIEKLTSW